MPRNELRTLNLPIAEELGKRAGSRPRVRPQECAPYAIADQVPKLVFSPRTLPEAAKTIATVVGEGAAVIIRGSGTKQFRPPPPYDVDVVLDTSRCCGVIEYTPADLTVTVAAGTKFADLQETLRANGQFFPDDPPFATQTTVGGMLSSRSAGALRLRWGSPRDNVLGMRVCLSDGSIAFTGSKVVKSVAGYDIPKLFVGACGTLGLIGEVTLKVAPLPQDQRGVVATFARSEAACDAALQLASSPLFPLATTLHERGAARRIRALAGDLSHAPWSLCVRCGGTRASLIRQVDAVSKLCVSAGAAKVESLDLDRLLFAWSDIAELAGGAAYNGRDFVCCKITSLATQVPAVLTSIEQLFPEAQSTAHPALGIAFAHVPVASEFIRPNNVINGFRLLAERCEKENWSLTYLAAPPHLGARLRSPVPAQAPVALMRRIKAAFDPSGTFDPGRFLAGI